MAGARMVDGIVQHPARFGPGRTDCSMNFRQINFMCFVTESKRQNTSWLATANRLTRSLCFVSPTPRATTSNVR